MRKNYLPHFNKEHESNLAEIRVEEGYTLAQLARKAKCSVNYLVGLQNGMISPVSENTCFHGQPKKRVTELSKILNASLGDLFPRYICDIKRSTALTDDQKFDILHSNHHISLDNGLLREHILKVVSTLPKKMQKLLYYRFWEGNTLQEIADKFKITRERVRQIEKIALRKLKHPERNKKLREFFEINL